jgi:glutamate racemase
VEEGLIAGSIAENIVKLYLSELCTSEVEKTLLLGCTHYPLLKDTIKSVLSAKINVLDSATCCADYTKEFLRVNNIFNPQSESGRLDIYVTDRPKKFKTICSNFLGRDICSVTNISIS